MQEKPAVCKGGDLIFVGTNAAWPGADKFPERPVLAVVIAVGGGGHDLSIGQNHKLLYQSSPERPGVDLDALPGGCEDPRDFRTVGASGGRAYL